MPDKTLLEQWRDRAYQEDQETEAIKAFWGDYFEIEKGIYEKL